MFVAVYTKKICLTSDRWLSITTSQYMTLIAHYITKSWELQKKYVRIFLLSTHPYHSNLAEY